MIAHYLGWYILEHGYAMNPMPTYIAWCFGVGAFQFVAEAHAKRAAKHGLFTLRDDDPEGSEP